MKTARGIYLDINESDYYYDLSIGSLSLRFYFSSEVYRKKFIERLPFYLTKMKVKTLGYDYNTKDSKFYDSLQAVWSKQFYKTIEKRGFKVEEKKEGDSSWQVVH